MIALPPLQTAAMIGGMAETTINDEEVGKFDRMATDWWNPKGVMGPLHRMNPIRVGYIRDAALRHFRKDPNQRRPLEGLTVVDVGCGGGILCEPLARLGASVTGIDAATDGIRIAKAHAEQSGLAIDYRAATSEALVAAGEVYDIVLNMEVVEHVDNVPLYMKSCADLVKPGGLLVSATLNRTLRALALGIFVAENVLRWLPRGTHSYSKFLTPDELTVLTERYGLKVTDRMGVIFDPLRNEFRTSADTAINYMLLAEKPVA